MENIINELKTLISSLESLDKEIPDEEVLKSLSIQAQRLRIVSEDLFVLIRSLKRYFYNSKQSIIN